MYSSYSVRCRLLSRHFITCSCLPGICIEREAQVVVRACVCGCVCVCTRPRQQQQAAQKDCTSLQGLRARCVCMLLKGAVEEQECATACICKRALDHVRVHRKHCPAWSRAHGPGPVSKFGNMRALHIEPAARSEVGMSRTAHGNVIASSTKASPCAAQLMPASLLASGSSEVPSLTLQRAWSCSWVLDMHD